MREATRWRKRKRATGKRECRVEQDGEEEEVRKGGCGGCLALGFMWTSRMDLGCQG